MSEIKLCICRWRIPETSCVNPAIITALSQSVKEFLAENKRGESLGRLMLGNKIDTSRRDLHLREVFDTWRYNLLI